VKPWQHAKISAHKFGGEPADYIEIHNFFDETKAHVADMRHRIILHNSFGIWICERTFGTVVNGKRLPYIVNSTGREVQVRDIGEQHVIDDLGRIPSLEQCLASLPLEKWMGGPTRKRVRTFEAKTEMIQDLLDKLGVD
jgi:hypothetical protein